MDDNDRRAIDDLFNRLSDVERQAGARDAAAESLIKERVAGQPASPYFMAQTIVVQEQALNMAQQRIEQLEQEMANRQSSGGGLLSSLFGGGSRPAPQPMRQPAMNSAAAEAPYGGLGQPQAAGPWGQQSGGMPQRGGGGFLAGAAQTAMGVAGGVLLGNAIAGMFAGDTANAAPAAEQPATEDQDTGAGDDMGDMGDMEF